MFRPSYMSPFSLTTDLDMWDTKSRFTAQSSAWCGVAAVSGTGFLSNTSSSTSGSTAGFRQNDPGLRKWQSLSHLVPDGATQAFPPSPGAELRAARGESSFIRQAEGLQWLQDAHQRLDTQLDRLRARNSQLSYNITAAQLLDMKHKQLSETKGFPEQQKETAELSQFEKQRGELHEKVQQLEKELLQMRSTLDRRSNDQPTERNFTRQEKQKVDTELHQLREALREAESRVKTQEEERNQVLQKLQTSTETQKMLLNQIEEMKRGRQKHSVMQEQLSEANNKISQAVLEKAILSTQVLKLEDVIKELKAKLTGADKDHLIQEQTDVQQRTKQGSEGCDTDSNNNNPEMELMKEELKSLSEANEKLTRELEMMMQTVKTSQSQIEEVTAERTKLISDLEAEQSQLIREKEDLLSQTNEGGHEEFIQMKDKCCQLRESVEVLELEKQKLQDRCLCLKADILEKEEKLHLQEEEHLKQDADRVQSIEELKAVSSHWTGKWQKVALTLQSTQEELDRLKKNNSRNEKESYSLLRLELDACKQKLELERSRSQTLLHRYKDKGAEVSSHTEDAETQTELSESYLLWETPANASSSHNKTPQTSEDDEDDGGQTNVSTSDSLKAQLEESRMRVKQLQQEETLAVQKLQTLRQLHPVKDEKPSVEHRKDQTVSAVNPETHQQRRMITEQLKSLFKEREGKEAGKVDNRSAAGQTGASSLQDWSQTSKAMRNTVERRSWQQGSCLMPVFEEEEEEEEGEPAEEDHDEENFLNQMSTMRAEICNQKAKNELQATLRCKQPIQDCPPSAKMSCLEEQMRPPPPYPDGIFLAELVDICSPNEDEDEGEGV